jgi:hypothetical protein
MCCRAGHRVPNTVCRPSVLSKLSIFLAVLFDQESQNPSAANESLCAGQPGGRNEPVWEKRPCGCPGARVSPAPGFAKPARGISNNRSATIAGLLAQDAGVCGPGYMVAVGYMDPGNWATDLAAGARFNYTRALRDHDFQPDGDPAASPCGEAGYRHGPRSRSGLLAITTPSRSVSFYGSCAKSR